MYEKILAQLVAKNPGVSKLVLGLIAKKLAPKVTEETEIEGAISEFETNSPLTIKEIADFHQQESDKRVTEAVNKAKGKTDQPPPKKKKEDEEEQDVTEEVPKWAKGLTDKIESLEKQLAGEKTKGTISELVTAAKLKGIPERIAKKYQIGEDYDQTAALEELETEWTEIKQFAVNGGVETERVATGQRTDSKNKKEASKEEADAVLNKII